MIVFGIKNAVLSFALKKTRRSATFDRGDRKSIISWCISALACWGMFDIQFHSRNRSRNVQVKPRKWSVLFGNGGFSYGSSKVHELGLLKHLRRTPSNSNSHPSRQALQFSEYSTMHHVTQKWGYDTLEIVLSVMSSDFVSTIPHGAAPKKKGAPLNCCAGVPTSSRYLGVRSAGDQGWVGKRMDNLERSWRLMGSWI